MTDQFSWQTDEEGNWVQQSTPPTRRGRWSLILFVCLVVAGMGYGLYRFSLRQLALRQEIIKTEIRAAHATWLQAVEGNDLELLTMLSTRADADWYAAQRRLLLSGRMLDRAIFGLNLTFDTVAEPEIVLAADLADAELRFQEAYEIEPNTGMPPVVLEQTAFYERKNESWAQRPFRDLDWGGTQQTTTPRIEASYPMRDAAIIGRIVSDLDRDVGTICQKSEQASGLPSPFCGEDGRVRINFDTDPEALLTLTDSERPALDGLEFHLPAPSLVGLPVDNAGYDSVYRAYADRILRALNQVDSRPVPLPSQNVATLCYATTNSRLDLYEYSPTDGRWTLQVTDRAYRYLRPTPDDNGLILRAGFPGIDLDRLQLTLNKDSREFQFLDVGEAELSASFAAFAETETGNDLVVRFGHGSTGIADYALVPLSTCEDAGSCTMSGIDGFPLWAPGGADTIVSDVGQLWVGDSSAQPRYSLGAGFSPFWLTPTTFGYVALAGTGERSEVQVVVQDLMTGQQQIVSDSAQLSGAANPEQSGRFRIRYVTVSPADPKLVIVGGSIAGSPAEEYQIMGIRLNGDLNSVANLQAAAPEVLLTLPGTPEGDPAIFTPTGNPGFSFSEDGRWLVAVRFTDRAFNTWEISLVDLQTRQTKVISTNYPPYPALYPHFDWSADGQWLVLVDNGFLRLIAPAHDYELYVPHEFRDCTYTGWINP